MENLILVAHILIALAIVGLILLQQGKGAEMGASFGAGASQTLFGAGGSGNFFSKLTAGLAALFFVTSFSLAVIAKQVADVDTDADIPTLEESSDVPVVEEEPAVNNDVPVLEEGAAEGEDIPTPADNDVPAGDMSETGGETEQAEENSAPDAEKTPATETDSTP